jgi:CHAD domain-containing protein
MADGKWIEGLTGTMPMTTAARLVLEARLEAVDGRMIPAAERAHENMELVHQLRVATRRARAAIDLFDDCLSRGVYRKLRKVLRRIRRAAGPARDWDVFLVTLHERIAAARAQELPGLHAVAGHVSAHRKLAQEALVDSRRGLHDKLLDAAHDMLRECGRQRVSPNGGPTMADLARQRLTDLLASVETAASGPLESPESLHTLRIFGKRLRYAMEVFADCFPPALRDEIYPRVEQMQESLGVVNDSQFAVAELQKFKEHVRRFHRGLWSSWRPGVDGLIRWHRLRAMRERRRFARFWSSWEKAAVGQRFRDLLEGASAAKACPLEE